jgi:hypothetical protein
MDIRCVKCGEPWDIDSLHDEVEAGTYCSFDEARRAFASHGCSALGCSHGETLDPGRQSLIAELTALAGDDVDGLASDLEDAAFLGVI